jgi:hypothetical protein
MIELIEMLKKMEQGRFYGSLEIKFEAGKIVLIRKSESFKPTEANYNGNNRSVQHDGNQPR